MPSHEHFMLTALELARRGAGFVAPNPMVGCIVVHEGEIIGQGYHEQYGQSHAEVNAISSVKDKGLLSHSAVYVTLEPCAHHGKTPPCADLLVENKVKTVVIGCLDSYSEVAGKGVDKLKNAGIEVELGILEEECRELNKRFFTFHEKKRPFVILKWAQNQLGLMDNTNGRDGEVDWITGKETQKLVHRWRAEEQGILVGKNTINADDPSLTVRIVEGKNPTRIVLDSQLQLNENQAVFNDDAFTYRFNTLRSFREGSNEDIEMTSMGAKSILKKLHELSIQSVIIEGGSQVLSSFIAANLWDEARVLHGNNTWKEGTLAPQFQGKLLRQEWIGEDIIKYYSNDD